MSVVNISDAEYEQFVKRIDDHFKQMIGTDKIIFTTDASKLWKTFLINIDPRFRQQYNCNTCKNFIRKYGSLAIISEGCLTSPIWSIDDPPPLFKEAFKAMNFNISKSFIQSMFFTDVLRLGASQNGGLYHFSVVLPENHISYTPDPKGEQHKYKCRKHHSLKLINEMIKRSTE